MFCEKCGNQIIPGDAFCTQCGTPVESQNTETVVNNTTPVETPEDKKKANMLCTISLILKYGMGLITGIVSGLLAALGSSSSSSYSIASSINIILTSLTGIGALAAFVLMIVVRVKYPKNTFGKVLMWIYIIEIILSIIAAIFVVVACMSLISSCR